MCSSISSTKFSNIIYKSIAFITIPIFTRILSQNEYGIVNTYMSYVSIFQVILGLATEMSIRNAFVDYKEKLNAYIISIWRMCAIHTLIVGGIVIIANRLLIHLESDVFWILCIIHSFMTYVTNVMLNMYMMEGEYKKRSILMVVPNLLSVVSGVCFILLLKEHKEIGRILGYVISFGMFGCFYIIRVRHEAKKILINNKIFNAYCKYALKISLPLILHTLSVSVLSQFDRVMITYYRGGTETAIYSIVYNLSMVAFAVTGALQNVWIPWFTQKIQQQAYEEINQKAKLYLYEGLIIVAGVMLVAPEILMAMTEPEYWSGIDMIIPLVATSFIIFMYSFSSSVELYHKSTKIIAIITAFAALLNLGLNYMIIPKYGAIGAAYTTLISYGISFLLHYIRGRQLERKLFSMGQRGVMVLLLLLMCLLCGLLKERALIRWMLAVILGIVDIVLLYR